MAHTVTLRPAAILAVAVSIVAGNWVAAPSAAATEPRIASIELVPAPGTTLVVGDRSYQGVLRVGAGGDGLVLTEQVTLDQYLAGIREVPFSWPLETLSAQVVAARTYLAYTLMGGRTGDPAHYGFDICATSACQVYAGAGLAAQESGDRWVAAVQRTARQILMYEGRPAQTVYSSSTGSRTRPNQDIWGGAPLPYLQAVDSPEENVSPFDTWLVDIPPDLFVRILERDGYHVSGNLQSILVRDPGEGDGPTSIWVETTGGTDVVGETDLKGAFNRQGPVLAPGLLPMRTGGGGRLPQALPSYTYEISFVPGAAPSVFAAVTGLLPAEDVPITGELRIEGEGWGHGVGMSQWGAKAMGDLGASHQEILAHYYGGLEPVDGGDYVPEDLVVGLGWKLDEVAIEADAGFEIRLNGATLAVVPGGAWAFHRSDAGIVVVPPDDLDLDLGRLLADRHWPR